MSIFDRLFKKIRKLNKKSKMPSDGDIKKWIEAFLNRKKYKDIDENILREIKDEDLVQAIIDYICNAVIKDDWQNIYAKIKMLPIGFQHIYGTWVLEAEVNNGGFNQYFYNTSGQFIDETHLGFVAIGASKSAEVVEKAVETIMNEKEMQLEMRQRGTIEAFSESYKKTKLGDCDKEFYECSHNIEILQIKYIRNNYGDFRRREKLQGENRGTLNRMNLKGI
jgi:hypothetical protein